MLGIMPTPKKPKNEPKKPRVRKGKALNCWIDSSLRDRLDQQCDAEQRTLTVVVERALRAYFDQNPPPTDDADGDGE